MKKIGYIAIASLLALNSCSGFLDEDLKSSVGPDNTYTTTQGFEVGITGLYEYARSEYNSWGGSDNSFSHGGATPYEVFQVGTDMAICGYKDPTLRPFDNLSYTPQSSYINSWWKFGYGLAANANLILEYSEHSDVVWDKPTDKAGFQAEARFFRAYAYRYLIYLFGDVPYVDKVERDFRTDFTRTPKAEVLGHMIDDLKFAAENLPEDPDAVQPGRLTKWAALHLLSEVYLMAGMNAEAEASAEQVINSNKFELMKERFGTHTKEPGDVFSDLFKENNQNRVTSGNKENIWVMQFEYNTTGGGGEYEDWLTRSWVPQYYNISGFVIADSLGGRGIGHLIGLPWWIGSDSKFFDSTDIRNSEYNIKRHWYYNDPQSELYGQEAEVTQNTWENGRLCPVITIFFYGAQRFGGSESYGGCTKDRIKSRLAETYLLLAEARMNQGDMEGAADAINEVRRRAHASEISASDVTKDFLADEHIRELAGEELRRFTLARLGIFKERVNKYNPNVTMDDKHLLWPIPQTVIDSNTDAEFPQNPGWE